MYTTTGDETTSAFVPVFKIDNNKTIHTVVLISMTKHYR